MISNNFVLFSFKVIAELVADITYFPLWWYGRGLLAFSKGLIRFLSNRQKSLALFIWIKNIFTPMYNQRDWQGWLISVFIRIVQIIFRGTLMLFFLFLTVLAWLFWVLLPFFVFFEIIFQLFDIL